jgi:hypothetical protein
LPGLLSLSAPYMLTAHLDILHVQVSSRPPLLVGIKSIHVVCFALGCPPM